MEESSQGKYIRVEKLVRYMYIIKYIHIWRDFIHRISYLSKSKINLFYLRIKDFKFIYPGWAASV